MTQTCHVTAKPSRLEEICLESFSNLCACSCTRLEEAGNDDTDTEKRFDGQKRGQIRPPDHPTARFLVGGGGAFGDQDHRRSRAEEPVQERPAEGAGMPAPEEPEKVGHRGPLLRGEAVRPGEHAVQGAIEDLPARAAHADPPQPGVQMQ